ncbi:hypothetical protein DXC27_19645 [Ruminococcus sp. OM08-7]|jgi:hypothetical protein|nr:hypothetical protein DXC27_19645 [Ruminococcus sp. OM08-7]
MTLNDYMDKGREEGLKKGLEEGLKKGLEEGLREESERYDKLIAFLVRDNNFTAFDKISRDNNYLQELFKHYGL